jgi:hypothetical protein
MIKGRMIMGRRPGEPLGDMLRRMGATDEEWGGE